ncbi:hypothetical protein RB598_000218 [Gaeumannomyces tritici]
MSATKFALHSACQMDRFLPNPLPLTEANLAEQQKHLPERRLHRAKREVYSFLSRIRDVTPSRAPARCRIRDAESVYITGRDEVGYRGSQMPKPDLEDPTFWERRLSKFHGEYQPIVSLETAKSNVLGALRWLGNLVSFYRLGREGRQFLKDYEIYLETPQDDISQLRHRSKGGPAPDLESVDFWKRHDHYLSWKGRQILARKRRPLRTPSPEPIWPPPPRSTSRTASFVYSNPGEVVARNESEGTYVSTVSSSSSVKLRRRKRLETMKVSLKPPATRQPSYSYETAIHSSAKPLDQNMWFPDPTLLCFKRDRARSCVRDMLWGLQDHCGEAGRQVVETADVYIAGDGNVVAHRRGQNAARPPTTSDNVSAPTADWKDVGAIMKDTEYWEEQEEYFTAKYQQLLLSANVQNKGSKRVRGNDHLDSSTDGRKRARPFAPAVVAAELRRSARIAARAAK